MNVCTHLLHSHVGKLPPHATDSLTSNSLTHVYRNHLLLAHRPLLSPRNHECVVCAADVRVARCRGRNDRVAPPHSPEPRAVVQGVQNSRVYCDSTAELWLLRTGVTRPVPTPVVASVAGGAGTGPMIALSTTIDALTVNKEAIVAFKSQNKGVMHACRHDVHTAMLLVTAKVTCAHQAIIKGSVRFVFQHPEELLPGDVMELC
ncbi:putative Peptidase family M20/M25/M40 [Leishmania naiffi]|uniref:Peptidase family M20/M25/M40 n=1 Tax=Leishmania naiffi TaxID=5678 RepID=A0AAW3BHK6_9TRYP